MILDGWPDFKEDTPLAVRDYWPFRDEVNMQNDVLYRGQCIIIPKALGAELLKRIHSSHIGGEACYRRARDTLSWPGMRAEIKDYIANCSACNEYARNQKKESMMLHEIPTRPWQTVSMDIYSYAGKEFLIIVDHYSDYWVRVTEKLRWKRRMAKLSMAHFIGATVWIFWWQSAQLMCSRQYRWSRTVQNRDI